MVSAHGRREQVRFAQAKDLSLRRACALLQVARSSIQYRSRMRVRDRELRQQLQTILRSTHAMATDGHGRWYDVPR